MTPISNSNVEPATDLAHLRAFLAAARLLHFTRAAAALGIAQPTLSLQIRQLERELGEPLFDRIGRRVRLTAAGELFRDRAAEALESLDRARQAVADLKGLRGGRLRVGVTHILATWLLPRVLSEFHRRHPGVYVAVEKLTSRAVEERLVAGDFDLGVTFTAAASPEVFAERLFEERIVLAVPAGHRLARRRSVRLAELAGLPLALTTREFATRQLLEESAAAAGVWLGVAMEFNDIDLLLAVVRRGGAGGGKSGGTAGGGVGGLATVVARRAAGATTGLSLVPIVDPPLTPVARLLWHRDRYRTAAARTFAGMLGEVVREGTRRQVGA